MSAVLAGLSARATTRREWARSRLADTYAKLIRAAHLAEEVVGNLGGEELATDEEAPGSAPHYCWSEGDQAHLDKAHTEIAHALAEVQMFSPSYVVSAARDLDSAVWSAQSYHRLAHEEEILELGAADDRCVKITRAKLAFIDAVRRDLGSPLSVHAMDCLQKSAADA